MHPEPVPDSGWSPPVGAAQVTDPPLELRLGRAGTTQDIDLRVAGDPASLLIELSRAGAIFALGGDFLEFTVGRDPRDPTIDGEGVTYQG